MPTDRTVAFLSFLTRTFWPILAFVLFLSIGLNAFFLTIDRFRAVKPQQHVFVPMASSGTVLDELMRGPKAFGIVRRGFSLPELLPPKGVSLPPISLYDIPADIVASLPPTLILYRDQGVDIDTTLLETIFHKLGGPFSLGSLQFFATNMSFRSSDRTLEISLDTDRRSLTLRKTGVMPQPLSSSKADDAECIALAKDFAASMGLSAFLRGEPRVVDRIDATAGTKTFVVWDATIDGHPLFTLSMQPVPKIEVQVGRVSKRAVLLRVNLLEAGLLARSAYPTAQSSLIKERLMSGGLLPLSRSLPGKKVTVQYTDMKIAYVLYPSDQTQPTYVVPIVRASWSMKPECAGCVPVTFATFVPALDPFSFLWFPETNKQ